MITIQKLLVAAAVALAAVSGPSVAFAERMMFGELVVLDGSPNRFRLVGHDGSFKAPSGTPLETLDGRPVEVEIGAGGQVVSITERPIPIDPVVSGWETVSGQLEVRDSVARTFSMAGDSQVYVAPTGVDLGLYSGRMVVVKLDANSRVTEITLSPDARGAAPVAVEPISLCSFGGQGYSDGATVCQAGTQYRCDANGWRNLGTPCGAEPPAERTCMFGGATVASGSSICRDGATVRCTDGTWINTQVACR
jgi:hypothetical protein